MRTPGILLLHLSGKQQCGRGTPSLLLCLLVFSKVINLNQTEHKDRGLVGPSFCLAYWFDNLQLERRPII